ncbi:MAG: transporter, family, putative rane transport protein [Pseudomonas sp.]|nr:transporter, family, putative rane transport protein [Pseudomonas sp.]
MNNPSHVSEKPSLRISKGTSAYRRISLALLMAGFATFALLYGAQPLLPLFANEYAISAAQSSLAVSFGTGAMALAFFPAGVISDRYGRLPVMIFSLFAASSLTLLSAVLPGWHTLLLMRALTGLALAGIPSVAMAYVAEELDSLSIGSAMGLYISGSAIGGMAGRLGVTLLTEHFGWRTAFAAMGISGLLAAVCFWRAAPKSRGFVAYRHSLGSICAAITRLLRDDVLRLVYAEGFLLMGAFVTLYNYLGFRLLAPPYSLSQTAVGSIFLMYIIGSFSSTWVGGIAGRVGRGKIFWMPILTMLAGIALTTVSPLWLIILGIGVIIGAFFGAHSVASGWVGQRATRDRAQASSLYLLFYYGGSSVLGSAGGVAWGWGAWNGVALFSGALVLIGLLIALRLYRVRSLAQNTQPIAQGFKP